MPLDISCSFCSETCMCGRLLYMFANAIWIAMLSWIMLLLTVSWDKCFEIPIFQVVNWFYISSSWVARQISIMYKSGTLFIDVSQEYNKNISNIREYNSVIKVNLNSSWVSSLQKYVLVQASRQKRVRKNLL